MALETTMPKKSPCHPFVFPEMAYFKDPVFLSWLRQDLKMTTVFTYHKTHVQILVLLLILISLLTNYVEFLFMCLFVYLLQWNACWRLLTIFSVWKKKKCYFTLALIHKSLIVCPHLIPNLWKPLISSLSPWFCFMSRMLCKSNDIVCNL